MNITERMLDIMNQKSIKASELAEELKINRSVISAWKKRGTNPPSEYLVQICKLLNISISELLGADEEGLNQEERKLIEYYRRCSQGNKAIILNAAEGLSNKELSEETEQETKSSTLKIG